MADEKPGLFGSVINWFKDTADWVEQNLGDPEIAATTREDLGLKPGEDLPAADKAKFRAFADGLDPDKSAFDATVEELQDVIPQLIQLGESLKDSQSAASAWDIAYMLGRIAAADSIRLRYPGLFALGKLLMLVSDDPESIDLLNIEAIVKLIKNEQASSAEFFTHLSNDLSIVPVAIDAALDPTWLDYFYGWDSPPNSSTPIADTVSKRTLTMLVGPEDAGPRAAVSMAGIPDEHGGPGLAVSIGGQFKGEYTDPTTKVEVKFDLAGAGGLSLFMADDFHADGSSDCYLSFTAKRKGIAGKPAFTIGDADKTRLECGGIGAGVELANDRAAVKFGMDKSTLVVTPGSAGSFLSKFLTGDARVEFGVQAKLSSKTGFTLEGGTGLKVTLPIEKTLVGALTVHFLTIGLGPSEKAGKDVALEVSGAFGLQLGPFQASVDRLGFLFDLAITDGNLGYLDAEIGFKPPNGIGLLLDAKVIRGGGYLYIDEARGEYAGALELKVDLPAVKIGIKAIGVLTTKMPDGGDGWALLLLIYGQFPPIQLSWGFTLTGLGGMIGLQHGVSVDALVAGMRNGVLDDILFPANPVADAPRIINRLRTVFPVTPRALILGPMAELGWGTPNIITIRMGVIIQVDDALGKGEQSASFGRIVILGQLLIKFLPGVPAEVRNLQLLVDFLGTIEVDPFRISFVARLRDSFIGIVIPGGRIKIDLGGMLVVQASFGDRPSFVLAAGGFHPDFRDIPPGIPAPIERLNASFPIGPVKLRIEAYFAITPASVQSGAAVQLNAKLGPVTLEAKLGFDAIVYLEPVFKFDVKIYGSAAVKYKGHNLAGVSFEFRLEGPGAWHARGFGKFSILFWDVEVPFDERWGSEVQLEPPAKSAQDLLAAELNNTGNWSAQLPVGGEPLVTLARIDPGADILAHPLGTLAFTQRALPFDLELQKIGTLPVEGPNQFHIESAYIGAPDKKTSAIPLQQHFAIGEFRKLSDADKLNQPGFQALTAGCRFSKDGYAVAKTALDQGMGYETLYLEPDDAPIQRIRTRDAFTPAHALSMAAAIRQAAQGAAARSPMRTRDRLKPTVINPVTVNEPMLATASIDKLQPTGLALEGAQRTAPILAADALAAANATDVQIVERFELA